MRIVHLLKHCNHGWGNVHVAVDLACVHSLQGHTVIYASKGGDWEELLASYGVIRERIDQGDRNPVSIFQAIRQLIRLCKKHKLDVIHAHMMSGTVLGYIVSLITGVPLVTTVHSYFHWHCILMRLGRIAVAVSAAEKELLLKRGFKPNQLVTVINGANQSPREKWLSGRMTVDLATPSVTMVCGLHQLKGVNDVISAFSRLHNDFPQWHLNLIGDGPDRAKLETLADELGVSKFVHFLGSILAPQPLLRKSAIFVSASYSEAFGLSTAEAREAGCAIVATAVGGTPELLEHGKAGRLVQPGHPEELEIELRKLMSDPNKLQAWQIRSKTGSDYFSVFRMAEDYQGVYERLQQL